MTDGRIFELELTVGAHILPVFSRLLQNGFLIQANVGCSVSEFLNDRLGLSRENIEKRISTVLLNGQPVDDLDSARIDDDSTLALSGAMPGLVGAVMRSNSPLRSFRSSITHSSEHADKSTLMGLIRLKLFNTVMKDLGSSLLMEGILLEPSAMCDFIANEGDTHRNEIDETILDGNPIEWTLLENWDVFAGCEWVLLSVRTRE